MGNFWGEKIISFNYKLQNQQSCETCLSRTLIRASRHSLQIAWFSSSNQMKLYSSSPQTAQISILRLCMVLRWRILMLRYIFDSVLRFDSVIVIIVKEAIVLVFGDWMINGARSLTKHIDTLLCLLLVTCFVFRSLFCPFTQVTK